MNLYRLSQTENGGYDTYSDCVVAAESAEAAQRIRPDREPWAFEEEGYDPEWSYVPHSWATKIENVKVELIGFAVEGLKAGLVCVSFHAG